MTCEEWERRLADEPDSEVLEHLAVCSSCRALAAELEANAAALRAMGAEVLQARSRRRRWIPAVAAALLVLTIAGARIWPQRPQPVRVRPQKTLMVKMLTPDPNVVIYWLIETKQGESE
jgi:ferric-dicitrate binding protein FerR (iron transport regulator)